MKVTYYTVYPFSENNEQLYRNYLTKELAKEAILKYYKPLWFVRINKDNLDQTVIHGNETVEDPIYKTYKTGTHKGEYVLNKNNEKIVIGYRCRTQTKVLHDFTSHNISKAMFYYKYNNNSLAYYDENYQGYFELRYIDLPCVDKDSSVHFSCNVEVRFITTKVTKLKEVKVEGLPYQAPSTSIEITNTSDWFTLYTCNGKYGLSSNLDNWYRTKPCVLEQSMGVDEHIIDIYDTVN